MPLMNIIPNRVFSSLYIILDCVFLTGLFLMLWFSGRKRALAFGLFGGVLYWLVDYGIFYLALGARVVEGANTPLFLFWLSMSYGFTNFVWIWLMLDRDDKRLEWSVLIFFSWIAVALLSENFGGNWHQIKISRTTTGYHGVMALILIVGYAFVISENIFKDRKIPLAYLLFIGITVQLGWETALLITGIRRAGIATLIIDSLIETNLGMPYIWYIHRYVNRKLDEKGMLMRKSA